METMFISKPWEAMAYPGIPSLMLKPVLEVYAESLCVFPKLCY